MKLPKLYKRTKTGAIQVCNISILDDTYTVEFGKLDGKLQEKTTKCFPKNIGRSNETTPEGQAFEEANSKWDKKVKSGYSTSIEAPVTVKLPQKVRPFLDHKNSVVYPAFGSYKLNGTNGIYWLLDDGSLELTSRGGEVYPRILHLEDKVLRDMEKASTKALNVELYIHGEFFQDITGAVKKTKELSKRLTANTFELPLVDTVFSDKVEMLNSLETGIEVVVLNSEEDADAFHSKAVSEGYEGIVVYNSEAVYKFNETSSNVFKYKIAKEAEFRVKNFKIDKNNHAVYLCESSGGDFSVKRKGTNEERLADANIAEQNIGRWLTIEYEMLSKVGKPQKPVGLNFRLCDENGQPLE